MSETKTASTIEDAQELLGGRYRAASATGSRVICPAVLIHDKTDEDHVVLVDDLRESVKMLVAAGFEVAMSMTMDADDVPIINDGQDFASLKSGRLNVILTQKQDFFDGFRLATRVAAKLGLNNRSDRVVLFQAILYRNG